MKKIAVRIFVIIMALSIMFSFAACNNSGEGNVGGGGDVGGGDTEVALTSAEQVAKAKEILENTKLTQAGLGINTASNGALNAAAEEALTKEQILDILNTQGIRGLATGDAADWGFSAEESKKMFMALYSIVQTGISQILDLVGENSLNQYYELEYKLAPEIEGYNVMFNPIAIRGVHRVTEQGKNGYSFIATSAYTEPTPSGDFSVKGQVEIIYFNEEDYRVCFGVDAVAAEEIYTIDYYTYDKATNNYEESCINKNGDYVNIYSFFNDKAVLDSTFKTAKQELISYLKNYILDAFAAMEKDCNDNNAAIKSDTVFDTYTDASGVTKPLIVTVANPYI